MRRPYIFIGLENIAGYSSMLQKGFNRLGIKCDLFTRGSHHFEYQTSIQNPMVSLFHRVFSLYKKLYQSDAKVLKTSGYIIDLFAVTPFFLYALFKYDVFIFTYKSCFYRYLQFIDLPILKWFHKKLIFVFLGSDARPPYINGAFLHKRGTIKANTLNIDAKHLKVINRRTREWKKHIQTIEKYADVIINHPPTSHFHEKPFVSFLHIGLPYEDKGMPPNASVKDKNKIKILHSPSYPAAKGTKLIRKAIQTLRSKGYPIDYSEIVNQPNHVVLEQLASSDFIVDQMYSDTPMPGFVTEAAAFGKPAVICGYYWEQIKKGMPPEKIPPSLFRHPDELEASIERLITDTDFRHELGHKARCFINQHWDFRRVAQRFLRMINQDIPHNWYFEPMEIADVHGACISEELAQKMLKALLDTHDKGVLCLSDKPYLEKLFLDFAYQP